MQSDRVRAVVVTHNRRALLTRVLAAMHRQTHPLERIVVVDNGSSDGTDAVLRQESSNGVQAICSGENVGSARGFSLGIEAAARDFDGLIWMLDDDAIPESDALATLVQTPALAAATTVGLAPLVVDRNGNVQAIHRGRFDPLRLRQIPCTPGEYSSVAPVPIGYSSFVGLLVKADAVRRIGLPADDMFIWFDDVEYTLRIRSLGSLYLVPASRVVHWDESLPGRRLPLEHYWKMYYDVRNTVRLGRLYGTWLSQLHYFVFTICRRVCGVMLFDSHPATRVSMIVRGYRDGLRGVTGKTVDPQAFRRPGGPPESRPAPE